MKCGNAVLAIVPICLLFSASNTRGQTKSRKGQMPSYEDSEGYGVLSVLLNRLSVLYKNNTIRIDPRTAWGNGVAEIKAQCSGIPEEFRDASENFDKRAETRLILKRRFTLRRPYELAHAMALARTSQPESRDEAGRRYRSGTYYVAAVGFNGAKTRAVAFVEYICGNLCGESIFYFLRKSDKGWKEDQEVQRQIKDCGEIY